MPDKHIADVLTELKRKLRPDSSISAEEKKSRGELAQKIKIWDDEAAKSEHHPEALVALARNMQQSLQLAKQPHQSKTNEMIDATTNDLQKIIDAHVKKAINELKNPRASTNPVSQLPRPPSRSRPYIPEEKKSIHRALRGKHSTPVPRDLTSKINSLGNALEALENTLEQMMKHTHQAAMKESIRDFRSQVTNMRLEHALITVPSQEQVRKLESKIDELLKNASKKLPSPRVKVLTYKYNEIHNPQQKTTDMDNKPTTPRRSR